MAEKTPVLPLNALESLGQQRAYAPIDDSIYEPIEYLVPSKGIAPDLSPAQCGKDFLLNASNFLWRDGRVWTRPGFFEYLGTGNFVGPVLGIAAWEVLVSGVTSAHLVAASQSATGGGLIYYLDGANNAFVNAVASAYTTLNSGAEVEFHPMRTASAGYRLIAVAAALSSDSHEPLKYWTGATATTFINLSTTTMGSHGIVWKSHFVIGDTTDTGDGKLGYRVHWSALGDPSVWTGTASAGSLDLIDANTSPIIKFLPLRRNLIVYKSKGIHSLAYKDPPFYFTQSLENESLEPLSSKAIVPVLDGDAHFIATHEGVILWDGQTIERIGRGRIDRTIYETLAYNYASLTSAFFWPYTNEVFLTIPTSSSTFTIYVYNFTSQSWWIITQHAFTAAAVVRQITGYNMSGRPYFLGATQALPNRIIRYLDEESPDSDIIASGSVGSAITASFLTGALDFDYPGHKRFSAIEIAVQPRAVVGAELTCSIGIKQGDNPLMNTITAYTTVSTSIVLQELATTVHFDVQHGGKWILYDVSLTPDRGEIYSLTLFPSPRTGIRRFR